MPFSFLLLCADRSLESFHPLPNSLSELHNVRTLLIINKTLMCSNKFIEYCSVDKVTKFPWPNINWTMWLQRYSPQHPSMMGGVPPRGGAPSGVRGAGNPIRTLGRGDYGKLPGCFLEHDNMTLTMFTNQIWQVLCND